MRCWQRSRCSSISGPVRLSFPMLRSSSTHVSFVHNLLASPNRRAGENGGATCRLRLDEQFATDQLQSLFHAGQAQAQTLVHITDVKAGTAIANGEIDRVASGAKMHIEGTDPTVSQCVVQRFLEHPEQTERHVSR